MADNSLTVPALRPTTALRDRIIERLSTGFAEGVIDTDEFERRVTVVHTSESAAEIEELVAICHRASLRQRLRLRRERWSPPPRPARTAGR